MRLSVFIVSLALYSCGGGGGSNQNSASNESNPEPEKTETPSSMYLETKDDLPECTESNKNALVYVADESEFFYCKSGDWTIADIKGKDGKDGKDGSDAEYGIKREVFCDISDDLDPDPDVGISARGAYITEYKNGDYQITCYGQMFDLNLGWFDNTSATYNWPSGSGKFIGCSNFYIKAVYSIDIGAIVYTSVLNDDHTAAETCQDL